MDLAAGESSAPVPAARDTVRPAARPRADGNASPITRWSQRRWRS